MGPLPASQLPTSDSMMLFSQSNRIEPPKMIESRICQDSIKLETAATSKTMKAIKENKLVVEKILSLPDKVNKVLFSFFTCVPINVTETGEHITKKMQKENIEKEALFPNHAWELIDKKATMASEAHPLIVAAS